jgi:ribosomal protein L37E
MQNEHPSRPPSRPPRQRGGADEPVGRAVPSTGVRCRRCGYDLRAASAAGRCPECGFAVALSLPRHVRPGNSPGVETPGRQDSWEPLSAGSTWLIHSAWLLVPAFLGTPALPSLGSVAAVLVGAYAGCHFVALRDLRAGLAALAADNPDVDDRLRRATVASQVFAACGVPIAVFPFLPCFAGSTAVLTGSYRFHALAVLTPLLAWALITIRSVGLATLDACDREEPAGGRLSTHATTAGLMLCAPIAALAWIAVDVCLALPPPQDEQYYAIFIWIALLSGVPMLWYVWRQMNLFSLICQAVPRSVEFSHAARRVARSAHAQALTVPRSTTPDELPDIPLAPMPPSSSDTIIDIVEDEEPPGESRRRTP